jgi:P4 family phage/plasmid primase-like protien
VTGERAEFFSQGNLAAVLAKDKLVGRYIAVGGLGWFHWTGVVWQPCPDKDVVEVARCWALKKVAKAADDVRLGIASDPATLNRWYASTKAYSSLRAIVALASGIEDVATRPDQLDADLDAVNTPSGIVDLVTGELAPHDPVRLMTKVTGVPYVPGATHADWNSALEAIPEDVRPYLQLRFGQALTGHPPDDDVLAICEGAGENGKSLTFNAVSAAMGDYAAQVSDKVLLGDARAHSTEFTELRGLRMATLEELPELGRLSMVSVKKLVGTGEVTARRMFSDLITFTATHSLFVSTNHRPVVQETDHGAWRRLMLIRFPFRFRKPWEPIEGPLDRRGDAGLRERVTHEDVATAVLGWLVAGAVVWYALDRRTPEPPLRITQDTDAWRRESDLILAFVADCLVLDPAAHVLTTELLAEFTQYLADRHYHVWSDKVFATRFAGHDSLNGKVTKKRVRRNASLSRRINGWPGQPGGVPDVYAAWCGVRFRAPSDDAADELASPPDPRVSGLVPDVPAEKKVPYIAPRVETFFDPEHPEQTLRGGVR